MGVRLMPKRKDIKTILVIGSGPIIIGQAAEFDYAGTQACLSLREEGYEVILVNSNPATIMTDKEIADKVYIEPLTIEFLSKIIRKEKPDALLPTLGGQVALNLAVSLHESGILDECGVEILGTKLSSIKQAEDRELFRDLMNELNEPVPDSAIVHTLEEAEKFVKEAHSVPLDAIEANDAVRLSTGIAEFDRVLGGGAVKRSAILIGGEPGIGKSTLLLQAASASSSGSVKKVLYVSGEESGGQIRSRADRLNLPLKNIELLCTCRLEDVERVLNKVNPVFVIIDSIQTMYSADAGAVPGTINQLKLCAHELVSWVKERDSVLFLTAHVTKDGNIAGPKVLEHLVDTVISFERTEDDVRFLRALKNRFGSVDELGIFSMDESGLKAIDDPSSLFITNRTGALPAGSAAVPVCEGSRVFMVEIQALTVPAKSSMTRVSVFNAV